MLSSQETCPHCGLVSVTDSPYANRSGNAVQYSGGTGLKNATSLAWALPLACFSIFLAFIGGKGIYFAMLRSGAIGKPSSPTMGLAAYDGLIWYFQLPIAIVLLLAAISMIVASWRAVFDN